jgi:hypothetical protein
MATVNKTFSFSTTLEDFSLFSAGGNGTGDVTFDTGLLISYANPASEVEDLNVVARLPTATYTWENWGVPVNSTVTSIQLADVSIATQNTGDRDLDTATFYVRVYNGNASVLLATPLNGYALPVIDGTTYQYDTFYGAGPQTAVNLSTSQASSSTALIELDMNYITLGGNNSDLRNIIIDLSLDINYDPPASATKYYFIT